MHRLITYLLAFAIGMVTVGALPRLRERAAARPERRPGAGGGWLEEHRLAVALWALGCLLTGALAALVAGMAT